MAKRAKLNSEAPAEDGGLFLAGTSARPYFSSGCMLLNLSLGGGWGEGQMINIVGDSGSGKSLVAMEAAAEFLAKFPGSRVRVLDVEHAYDKGYLESIGIPLDRIDIVPDENNATELDTVQKVQKDILRLIWKPGKGKAEGAVIVHPKKLLYIVDSWDLLSDSQEMSKEMGASNAQASKAKAGSEFGRRTHALLAKANVTLVIISQIREKVGVVFGSPQFRAGGQWLNFYPSQIVWIARGQIIDSTRDGVKRPWAQFSRFKFTKSRRVQPMPVLEVPIVFNYGIDDLMTCTWWLYKNGLTHKFLKPKSGAKGKMSDETAKPLVNKYIGAAHKFDDARADADLARVQKIVLREWRRIEKNFAPARRKKRG